MNLHLQPPKFNLVERSAPVGAVLVDQVLDTDVTSAQLSATTLRALRQLWWRHAAMGHPLPAQPGVIVIEGTLA